MLRPSIKFEPLINTSRHSEIKNILNKFISKSLSKKSIEIDFISRSPIII